MHHRVDGDEEPRIQVGEAVGRDQANSSLYRFTSRREGSIRSLTCVCPRLSALSAFVRVVARLSAFVRVCIRSSTLFIDG